MEDRTVPWRRVIAGVIAVAAAVVAVIVVARSDGFNAIDATAPRSTRWFADRATGRVVLVDGYSGRALARLEPGGDVRVDQVVEAGGQAAIVDRLNATTRSIDGALLRLGPSRELPALASPTTVVGIGQSGLVAVEPAESRAFVVPPAGAPVNIDVTASDRPNTVRIAPDGAVWSLTARTLRRTTSSGAEVVADELDRARYTLVGNSGFVIRLDTRQARLGDGRWVPIPEDLPADEIILQEPSPDSDCGWLGANGRLICVGRDGITHDVTVPALDIDGGDLMAIAGDAAVVVDRSAGVFEQLDWRGSRIVQQVRAEVGAGTQLRLSASVDLIWVDSVDGGNVWAVNPWSIHTVGKDDDSTPLIGEDGGVTGPATGSGGGDVAVNGGDEVDTTDRLDNNGVDDPPIAVDDAVSSRAGSVVAVAVTANDYDPDGDGVLVIDATTPAYGTTEVTSATTVTYQPQPGYAGNDAFDYTIIDINGNEATATVRIRLIPTDAPNQPPLGATDLSQTGPGRAVTVDVLLNDVDPERDPMRIESYTTDTGAGTVQEVTAPSGLPGLRFQPAEGFFGRAAFDYVPTDTLGAAGDPVSVVVDVAAPGSENRPPVARPDAIRVRRGTSAELGILDNDSDPDGDDLTVEIIDPMPDSVDAEILNGKMAINARPGAKSVNALWYRLSDGRGGEATGSVIVGVVGDDEPNRPPVANADNATAVAESSTLIDVLQNDTDPDGDPLVLLSASTSGAGSVRVSGDRVLYTAPAISEDEAGLERFVYVISDGQGHQTEGTVSVRVLPERLPDPPVALPDSVTTQRDTSVEVDVLSNDSDPSGGPISIVADPGCPSGGTARVTDDDRVRYTPPAGVAGVFRCTYEIANSAGRTASSNITISVVAPTLANRPPLVSSEEVTVKPNDEVSVNVLANDTDPDGDSSGLRLVSVSEPVEGEIEFEPDGLVKYQAPATATAVSISYDVSDTKGAIASGRLIIRVVGEPTTSEPPRLAPIAVDDQRTVTAPVDQVVIDVLANDTDPDGDDRALSIRTTTLRDGAGSASVDSRGLVVAPSVGFVGKIVIEYTVVDSDGLTDTAVATVNILEIPNRPPIAADDEAKVAAGMTVVVPIAANDADPDGDPLTYSIVSFDRGVGDASIRGGELVFTSTGQASATTSIVYSVTDGRFTTEATVRIEVLACSAAPPKVRDGFLETGYREPIAIDLTDWVDSGNIVEISGAILSPVATYTPPAGFSGNATITFAAENSCGDRAMGELTIDVNQDPVANPLQVEMGRSDVRTISVYDFVSDDESLTIGSLSNAPPWVTIGEFSQSIVLKPSGASGRANFEATVSDPGGLSVRVPITVSMVNVAPIPADDAYEVAAQPFSFDPLHNDIDPDGDTMAYRSLPTSIIFSNGLRVPIVREAGTTLKVDLTKADGPGRFVYDLVDNLGAVSKTAIVSISVIRTPPAIGKVRVELDPDSSATVVVPYTDADGEEVAFSIATDDVPDGITMSFEDDVLTVEASADALAGNYRVPYTATDAGGRFATDTIILRVRQTGPVETSPPTEPPT